MMGGRGHIRLSAGSRAGLEEEAEAGQVAKTPRCRKSHRKFSRRLSYLISQWPHELDAFIPISQMSKLRLR